VQLLRDRHDDGGGTALLAAVGQLQFDVVSASTLPLILLLLLLFLLLLLLILLLLIILLLLLLLLS
jgi:hypothetical protein